MLAPVLGNLRSINHNYWANPKESRNTLTACMEENTGGGHRRAVMCTKI